MEETGDENVWSAAAGDGGATARVRIDRAASLVAVVSVVRAAGAGRARDPVGGKGAVGNVVVDSAPEERSAGVLL